MYFSKKTNQNVLKTSHTRLNNYLSFVLRIFLSLASNGVALVFLICLLSYSSLHVFDTYIFPLLDYTDQLKARFDESYWENRDSSVFFGRVCERSEIIGLSQKTVFWNDENIEQFEDFTEMVMMHGAGIIPNILDSETVDELRKVIIRMNLAEPEEKQFSLKEPSHRWSLRLNPYDYKLDPEGIVRRAMKMIASNPTLKNTLEDILGPDPAINEVAAITSEPGAPVQDWHSDVWGDGSAHQYPRTYSSQYSLFLYLQDTYADMGSTGLCLNTHQCLKYNINFSTDICFQVEPPSGAGVLLNGQLLHQGSANTAHHRSDGTRVMLIISFSSARRPDTDQRLLSMGSVYAIPWYLWGHNLNDMLTMDTQKWNILHTFGILNYGNSYGYNYLLGAVSAHGEHGYNGIEEEWFLERDFWENFHDFAIKAAKRATYCYLLLISVALMSIQVSGKTTIQSLGIIKLFIFCLTFLIFITSCLYLFSVTDFAQGITSGRRFRQVPFRALKSSDLTYEYLEDITEPKTCDVLYGERLDAYYLFKNVYFYDYHPGNRHFMDIIKEYAFDYIHVPLVLREKFIQQNVMKELEHDTEKIRFLLMNDFGHWSVMDKKMVSDIVRKELFNANFPIARILSKEIDFILSQAKYGDGGRGKSAAVSISTAMSRKHIPDLVIALKTKIYIEGSLLPIQKTYMNLNFSNQNYIQNPSLLVLPSKYVEKYLYNTNNQVDGISTSNDQSSINYADPEYYGGEMLQKELLKYGNLQRLDGEAAAEDAVEMFEYMESYPEVIFRQESYSGDRIRVNEILRIRETCKNLSVYCLHWAVAGFCDDRMDYMLQYCRPSCYACHVNFVI